MGNPAGVRIDYPAREARRLAAIKLIEKGLSRAEIARRVGVAPQTLCRWATQYQAAGIAGVRWNGRIGRPQRLNDEQKERLKTILTTGPETYGYAIGIWTLPRIAHVIEKEFKVSYHPSHVWKLLTALGWSCQRPAKRALERDEEQIRVWKQKRWPALKKTPKRQGKP
jgi:transposase